MTNTNTGNGSKLGGRKVVLLMLGSVLALAAAVGLLGRGHSSKWRSRLGADAGVALPAPDAGLPGAGARLQGRVVDETGKPVVGAQLRARALTADASALTRSDSQGRFSLSGLPADGYRLQVEAEAHSPTVLQRVVVPSPEPLTLVLERTSALHGTVQAPPGTEMGSVEVVVAGSGMWPPRKLNTDADGRFRLSPVPAGVYELRARAGQLTSDPVEGVELDAGGQREVSLSLYPGQALSGRVFDAESGAGLDQVAITLSEDSLSFAPLAVMTDEEGRYRMEGLRPMAHRVSLHRAGYVAVLDQATRPGDAPQDFPLRRGGVLAGRVVDARGQPVPGAQLEVRGRSDFGAPVHLSAGMLRFRSALFRAQQELTQAGGPDGLGVTRGPVPRIDRARPAPADGASEHAASGMASDAQGRFRIEGVPPGRHRVGVRKSGFAPTQSEPVELKSGGEQAQLEIVLGTGATLSGRVLDGSGTPVGYVRLELAVPSEDFPRMTLSSEQGEFSFEAVRGRCVLTAYAIGLHPVRQELDLEAGADRTLEVVLPSDTLLLVGQVLDGQDTPLARVSVMLQSLRADTPVHLQTRSGPDGRFELPGLPPPPYQLSAELTGFAPAELQVESLDSPTLLRLQPGAVVAGTVMDSWNDTPLAGARITLAAAGGRPRRSSSDQLGSFEFHDINAGNQTLTASARGFISETQTLTVEAGQQLTDVSLELEPGGSISGDVVDRLGVPVFGAQVAAGDPPSWDKAQRSDHQGAFRLPDLAPGEYLLSARIAGDEVQLAQPVKVHPLQETPGVVLRLASIRPEPAGGQGPTSGSGLAVTLANRGDQVWLEAVAQGSGAARAGLRAGDRLLRVNDEAVFSAGQGRGMLRGPAGSRVVLQLQRGQRQLRKVVARERYQPQP